MWAELDGLDLEEGRAVVVPAVWSYPRWPACLENGPWRNCTTTTTPKPPKHSLKPMAGRGQRLEGVTRPARWETVELHKPLTGVSLVAGGGGEVSARCADRHGKHPTDTADSARESWRRRRIKSPTGRGAGTSRADRSDHLGGRYYAHGHLPVTGVGGGWERGKQKWRATCEDTRSEHVKKVTRG